MRDHCQFLVWKWYGRATGGKLWEPGTDAEWGGSRLFPLFGGKWERILCLGGDVNRCRYEPD